MLVVEKARTGLYPWIHLTLYPWALGSLDLYLHVYTEALPGVSKVSPFSSVPFHFHYITDSMENVEQRFNFIGQAFLLLR